ncbi:PadR family transcriptional regulator [Bacillus sp. AK128]
MEERLKNLKNAMKRMASEDLTFTVTHKENFKRKINQLSTDSEEDVLVAIFQLLKEKRTGFELSRLLRTRGMEMIENEEGFLYMSLHKFEHKGYLTVGWEEPDVKYYQLSNKGMKILKAIETKAEGKAFFLKEIAER